MIIDKEEKRKKICEELKDVWDCTILKIDVMETLYNFECYEAVVILVERDKKKLGCLIWEIKQYSCAVIIVIVPEFHAVKKYIEWGADLVFPHALAELINVYLYALFRRLEVKHMDEKNGKEQNIVKRGKLLIDWNLRVVYWNKKHVTALNDREKKFLYILAESSRKVVTYKIIFEQLWEASYEKDSSNMIWCFVRRLRKKLVEVEPEAGQIVRNVRKVGYYLNVDVDA